MTCGQPSRNNVHTSLPLLARETEIEDLHHCLEHQDKLPHLCPCWARLCRITENLAQAAPDYPVALLNRALMA